MNVALLFLLFAMRLQFSLGRSPSPSHEVLGLCILLLRLGVSSLELLELPLDSLQYILLYFCQQWLMMFDLKKNSRTQDLLAYGSLGGMWATPAPFS